MNDRFDQLMWMANGNPETLEKFKQMPVVEYYQMLDAKIEVLKKNAK